MYSSSWQRSQCPNSRAVSGGRPTPLGGRPPASRGVSSYNISIHNISWSDLTLQGYTVNLGWYPHFGYCGTRCITVLKLILSHRKHSGITRIVDCYWTEIHPTALSSSKVEIIMLIKRSARSEKKPQLSFCSHLSATRRILELGTSKKQKFRVLFQNHHYVVFLTQG